jgi:hypothetical protein
MGELGDTSDPKALVPGNPEAIEENARVLRARAQGAFHAGHGLTAIDTGSWEGEASRKFHDKFSYEPPKWLAAGDAMDAAAVALDSHAETLRWAQRQAADAIRLWEEGQAATRKAEAAHEQTVAEVNAQNRANTANGTPTCLTAPPFHDPGEATRQAARETLDRARQQLTESGERTASVLQAETQNAPEESNWLDDAGWVAAEFGGGVWDTVSGLGETLWDVVPVQAIWDPQGYADGLTTIASSAWHSATHPIELAKSMVAWDTWEESPGRAVGQILGGVGIGRAAGKVLGGSRGTDGKPDTDPAPEKPSTSTTSGRDLNRSLASDSQTSGSGTAVIGAGTRTPLRDAPRLAENYGGAAEDWAKMTSKNYSGPDGRQFETHWYENTKTGERVEYKTKLTDGR